MRPRSRTERVEARPRGESGALRKHPFLDTGAIRQPIFPIREPDYRRARLRLIDAALAEDIGAGDCTTAALRLRQKRGRADIVAHKPGVLAGADVCAQTFHRLDRRILPDWHISEGGHFRTGDRIASITGRADAILTAERTALNFLSRLSGIATATWELAGLIPRGSVRLLDTRKTTPGWRLLEKRAAAIGGAVNHRLSLDDAFMIKDNHIVAYGDLAEAIRRVRRARGRRHLICEVKNLHETEVALDGGVTWLLLDNFTASRLRVAVRRIREFERSRGTRILIEASGGINAHTISAIAGTGVDFVSAGRITHSAPAIDFSLEWIPS